MPGVYPVPARQAAPVRGKTRQDNVQQKDYVTRDERDQLAAVKGRLHYRYHTLRP